MLRLLILLALLFGATVPLTEKGSNPLPAPSDRPAYASSDGDKCCPGPPPLCPPFCGSEG